MIGRLSERLRWVIVVAFAIAMAWVESASVFYIRALVDRIEPYQPNPLPVNDALGNVELWREAATLVMLATVGLLAGRTWRRRAGYAAGSGAMSGPPHARPAVIVAATASRVVAPTMSITASPAVPAAERATTEPVMASVSPS